MSWEPLEDEEMWVREYARERRYEEPEVIGTEEIVNGENRVYKIEYGFKNHGHDIKIYTQLKSDYYETTNEEGTCPNCQKYVRREEGDKRLTCHRCGWTYRGLLGSESKSPIQALLSRVFG